MSISGIVSQSGYNPTEMAAQFFKKADANGDGGIDKAEFKTMMSQDRVVRPEQWTPIKFSA